MKKEKLNPVALRKDLENQMMGKTPWSYSTDPAVEAVVLARSLSVPFVCY